MRRYVIIIGAMKSGTTTLFDMLAEHPQIAPSDHKEPGFFAFDDVWSRGFSWFDTLYDFDPSQHRYRLEASTDYTKAPFVTGCWDRMTADPEVEVKLIYIMRHPLRRLESHARHVQRTGKEIAQQHSPKTDHSLDAGLSLVNLVASHYASQLDHYRVAWENGALHCLTLEELKAAPAATLRKIWDFLGLEAVDTADTLPASNAAADKTRVHPAWVRLRHAGPLTSLGRAVVPRGLRGTLRERLRHPVTVEGRFQFDPAEESFLSALLAGEIARLQDTYRLDTRDFWGL